MEILGVVLNAQSPYTQRYMVIPILFQDIHICWYNKREMTIRTAPLYQLFFFVLDEALQFGVFFGINYSQNWASHMFVNATQP